MLPSPSFPYYKVESVYLPLKSITMKQKKGIKEKGGKED
jgi:hypothetical protein